MNFVRFQSQVFTDWSVKNDPKVRQQQLTAYKLYLDECAMAGVYVLLDSGIDPLAIAGFNGTHGTAWAELVGNLSLVNTHPAFGGYYGCDDCCHMGSNINEHEYLLRKNINVN